MTANWWRADMAGLSQQHSSRTHHGRWRITNKDSTMSPRPTIWCLENFDALTRNQGRLSRGDMSREELKGGCFEYGNETMSTVNTLSVATSTGITVPTAEAANMSS
ncbi:hypothetical protein N7471_006888 [Penicillium samsonianum]|uniref:uncharacterized protein n=1 Tax=Penicillium samsonianum TaxID=1882272 RepID=UPI0025471470|nr:uncharacterized protein N7471_006888 [Penicillium samsonianum]KAJ6140402.1 hypothetical protein N7471_006888 [Penicillium samsonianum]